jgi:hypothetical protein
VLKSDYEGGLADAFLAMYPGKRWEGDSFHLHYNLDKRRQKEKITNEEYRRDPAVYSQVHFTFSPLINRSPFRSEVFSLPSTPRLSRAASCS